jgi:hypothetical protein
LTQIPVQYTDVWVQPLSLKTRVDRIGQHVVRARIFFDLWYYFEEETTRSEIIGTMRDYNEFFRFAPHAFLTSYITYIAGAFDKTRGTISLIHLIPEANAAGVLVAPESKQIADVMTVAEPIAKKVLTLRHKAFAHKSAHISYNDVFIEANVLPAQLRELTDLSLQIVNVLLLASELPTQHFVDGPHRAAKAMMMNLAGEP